MAKALFQNDYYIPTQEDLLDINFHSIVSDGRAILSGTLVPRSWADISSTWREENDRVKVKQMHKSEASRKKMSISARARWQKLKEMRGNKPGPFSFRVQREKAGQFRSMVYILTCNGMNVWDARMKARELLKLKVLGER